MTGKFSNIGHPQNSYATFRTSIKVAQLFIFYAKFLIISWIFAKTFILHKFILDIFIVHCGFIVYSFAKRSIVRHLLRNPRTD